MIKKQDGFTLVELMITMVIFVIAIAAASNIFTGILTNFKQQSKIAETNIEGVVGLEMLRYDVEQAGYGLPWDMNGATYADEAAAAPDGRYDASFPPVTANLYNDAPDGIPRAFASGDNVLMNGSDVLVIKATNVSTADAAQKWTYISNSGALPNSLRTWTGIADEILLGTDSIIVIKPVIGDRQRVLINNAGGAFSTTLNNTDFSFVAGGAPFSAFEPLADTYDTYIVYGINDGAARMPFNRADYYVERPADAPTRCEPSTGVLYKATINHGDGGLNELPILDCVADFQVVYRLDTDGDRTIDSASTDLAGLTAAQTRDQIKEIRIYIIAHEGQLDTTYTSPAMITIDDVGGAGAFKVFDFVARGISLNYRWKLYTLVVTPNSLR